MRLKKMGLETIGIFACLIATVYAQFECPDPWIDHDGKCYKFIIFPTSYESASQDCANDGAALISINGLSEHEFFQQWLIENYDDDQDWFTSGKRRESAESDPKFFWEGDGTEVQGFQFWNSPSDRFKNGDIIVYHTDTGSTRHWKLADKSLPHPYVCETSKEQIFRIIDTARGFGYGAAEVDPVKLPRGPKFTTEPQDFIYDKDSVKQYVEFECIAEGMPQPAYAWYKEENQRQVEVSTMSQSRYTVINGKMVIDHPRDTEDNGNYQCVANNQFGRILSNEVQLSFGYLLDFPKSKRDPVTVKAYSGVGIECNPPKHYPAVLYSWYKDSIDNFIRPRLKPYVFISHNGKLYFSAVTEDDRGEYYCLVSSPRLNVRSNEGKVSEPIQLNVVSGVSDVHEPQIASGFPTVFPSSPLQGDNVRMECFAWGTHDANILQYVWVREDGPMPERAVTEDYHRVLKIPDVQMIHSGRYRCTVTRVNGQSSSGTVQLPVDAIPFFTIPLKNEHVDLNSELRWLCIANGRPEPVYRWYRNAEPLVVSELPEEDRERITLQNNVLTINPVLEKDSGMYQCGATNLHGTRFSTAQLRVLSFAPTFEKYPMQPTTYATRAGNVTIICQPEAAPKGVKEWKKDGRTIVGQSQSRVQVLPNGNLHISNIRSTDEGEYTCTAINDMGRATSSSTLTILSSTTISHFPRNTVVEVNQTAFLPCQASYNPLLDLTYLWFHNGRQIHFIRIRSLSNEFYIEKDRYYARGTGINRGGLRIDRATFELAGRYTCVARTASDRIEKSADLKVIGPPGMPASIYADRVTSDSIVIHWVVGPSNGNPITSYTIEGYNAHEKYWRELKTNIRGAELRARRTLVTGLSPWSTYKFRIRAENVLGLGEPSWPSELYTTGEMPPQVAPQNVGGGGGKVGELVFTWDSLTPADQNGQNLHYIVYWKKSFIIDEEWTEVVVPGAETERYVQLVGQNNYYAKYDVKVRAVNKMGPGPESPSVAIYSAEDIPIGVATNVRSFPYNSTALRVTWNPVTNNRETMKGVLLGYRINYWKEVGEDETMSIYNVIPGQTYTGLVIGLEPHTYYYVNVQVYNSAGNGPKSQDYLEETLRAAPMNQPTEVHVKVVDHDSVSVDWRGVSTGIEEEPLQGYMVRVWRQGESIYYPTDYDSEKKTHYVIHGLDQNVFYNLRVFGYSRGGQGLMSSPTVQFVLGRSCRILEASPDKRFIYTCGSSSLHSSILVFAFGILIQYLVHQ